MRTGPKPRTAAFSSTLAVPELAVILKVLLLSNPLVQIKAHWMTDFAARDTIGERGSEEKRY